MEKVSSSEVKEPLKIGQKECERKKKQRTKRNADCNVRCEVCQVDFTDLFSLENHINQLSTIQKKPSDTKQDVLKCNEMSCSSCNFKFGGFDNLRRHVINSVCKDLDKFRSRLKTAEKLYSMVEGRLCKQSKVCPFCERVFNRRSSLLIHLKTMVCDTRRKNDKFKCNDCCAEFVQKYSLQRHHFRGACAKVKFQDDGICNENHEHQFLDETFSSYKEAKDFIKAKELDFNFIIRYQNKGKLLKNRVSKKDRYICRRMNKPNATSEEKQCKAMFYIISSRSAVKRNEHGEAISSKPVFLLRGCLTHSHLTSKAKHWRMPNKVRSNVRHLFRLGMSLHQIRDKFLPIPAFGGGTGHIPKVKVLTYIQRNLAPTAPEVDFSEREMVGRYIHMESVKALNLAVSNDPTTSNPQWASSKIDKSTKFVGLSHPMTFEAEDVILVFMTEYQRRMFRKISTTLLVNVIPIAYRIDGYYLLTLFILDEYGEAVPTMQAISCNDLVTSAKIILKTLKHLEPKACSSISVLMSDDFCYNAFVESVAEVLQLEVLTTIPLQKAFVDNYVRTVQCALAPHNERLDQIMYAFHKMMHHINRKIERIERGFRGEFHSFIQKDFIASHPGEVNTFTADVQPDGTWNILHIQSTEAGGQVLETQNVTKCAAMICNPKFCKVLCTSCPSGSPCLHEYVCSCPDYLQKSCCVHIHVISVLKLDPKAHYNSMLNGKIEPNEASTGTIIDSDRVNINMKNAITPKTFENGIDDRAIAVSNEEADFNDCKISAYRHLTAALCFVQNLKCSTISQSMCVNLVSAVTKFPEIPINKYRVTKYCTNAEGELPDFDRGTLLVKNEKGLKNRVPIWKEKLIDISEKDTFQQIQVANAVGKDKENIKMPQICLKQLPSKLVNGVEFHDSTQRVTQKRKHMNTNSQRKVIGRNTVRYNLLKEAAHKEVHEHCWIIILSQIEMNILALSNFTETEREELLQKMVDAKSMWACARCDSYQTALILGGYVECHVCCSWYHIMCCRNLINEHGAELEFDEDYYVCDDCTNLVIIE